MSDSPLHVIVISAEHIGHLPNVPVVSRTHISAPLPPYLTISHLEALHPDSDFWRVDWKESFIERLHHAAMDNSVGYVVPGHPMLGDATMRALIDADARGEIALELFDEPLPVILTELLSLPGSSPAFVDALTLLEIDQAAPFNAGTLPVSSNQTTIVTNVMPGINGADVLRILSRRYRTTTNIRLVPMIGDPEQIELELQELENEASGYPCYLVIPPVSGDDYQPTPDDLQRIVARLRAPGGCPWDSDQSNQTLSRNLIEESYELLDAIESGNRKAMREELGDFLLQAVMHAQITEEDGAFTLDDAIESLLNKLVRRHPHVFASTNAEDADAVVQTWDEIKREERLGKSTTAAANPLGDIPAALPALLRAQTVIKRALRSGLSEEELHRSTRAALESLDQTGDAELVERMIELVQNAREEGVDLEDALRIWTRRFEEAIMAPLLASDSDD